MDEIGPISSPWPVINLRQGNGSTARRRPSANDVRHLHPMFSPYAAAAATEQDQSTRDAINNEADVDDNASERTEDIIQQANAALMSSPLIATPTDRRHGQGLPTTNEHDRLTDTNNNGNNDGDESSPRRKNKLLDYSLDSTANMSREMQDLLVYLEKLKFDQQQQQDETQDEGHPSAFETASQRATAQQDLSDDETSLVSFPKSIITYTPNTQRYRRQRKPEFSSMTRSTSKGRGVAVFGDRTNQKSSYLGPHDEAKRRRRRNEQQQVSEQREEAVPPDGGHDETTISTIDDHLVAMETPVPQLRTHGNNHSAKLQQIAEEDWERLDELQEQLHCLLKEAHEERASAQEWSRKTRDSVEEWVAEQRKLIDKEWKRTNVAMDHRRQAVVEKLRDRLHQTEAELETAISHHKGVERKLHDIINEQAERITDLEAQLSRARTPVTNSSNPSPFSFQIPANRLSLSPPASTPGISQGSRDPPTNAVSPPERKPPIFAPLTVKKLNVVSGDGDDDEIVDSSQVSKIRRYRNGAVKKLFDDGTIITKYSNGDIKTVYTGGQVTTYFHAAERILHKRHATDGIHEYNYPNGQKERHYPDGQKEIFFPDGTERRMMADGSKQTFYKDGHCTIQDRDGNVIQTTR